MANTTLQEVLTLASMLSRSLQALLEEYEQEAKPRRGRPAGNGVAVRAARKLSPAARKRISAATKKRWADYRQAQEAARKPATSINGRRKAARKSA